MERERERERKREKQEETFLMASNRVGVDETDDNEGGDEQGKGGRNGSRVRPLSRVENKEDNEWWAGGWERFVDSNGVCFGVRDVNQEGRARCNGRTRGRREREMSRVEMNVLHA